MNSPTSKLLTLADISVARKRVLVRVDFNVPLKNGQVGDDTRIRASLPTIYQLLESEAAVMLMSHLGRPKEGETDPQFSLKPVAERLEALLKRSVPLVGDWLDGVSVAPGEIVMLENVRFEKGEKANTDDLARRMAALCDIYVNDAFATAHRAQASTCGVAKYVARACAGPLLVAEIEALNRVINDPARPMVAVVGGAKISTKLSILEQLMPKVDQLIPGGGIANMFLKAAGKEVGDSLLEEDMIDQAADMLKQAETGGGTIALPVDVVCAKKFDKSADAQTKSVDNVEQDDQILDVGPEATRRYAEILHQAGTIVWNGPMGVFEFPQFSRGTRDVAQAIVDSKAYSVAGGGDTLAAISEFGISERISYVSTGGGAFLEFLEGKSLPAIAMLRESARAQRAAEKEY